METMAFDLQRAFRKKQEHESARLMDFEFRQRARTFRLLARALAMDEAELVKRTARSDDAGVLEWLAAHSIYQLPDLQRLHGECAAQARRELIEEIGDPTPHRLL